MNISIHLSISQCLLLLPFSTQDAGVSPSYLRLKAGLHPVHRGAIVLKQTAIHTCNQVTDSELTANRAAQQRGRWYEQGFWGGNGIFLGGVWKMINPVWINSWGVVEMQVTAWSFYQHRRRRQFPEENGHPSRLQVPLRPAASVSGSSFSCLSPGALFWLSQ